MCIGPGVERDGWGAMVERVGGLCVCPVQSGRGSQAGWLLYQVGEGREAAEGGAGWTIV